MSENNIDNDEINDELRISKSVDNDIWKIIKKRLPKTSTLLYDLELAINNAEKVIKNFETICCNQELIFNNLENHVKKYEYESSENIDGELKMEKYESEIALDREYRNNGKKDNESIEKWNKFTSEQTTELEYLSPTSSSFDFGIKNVNLQVEDALDSTKNNSNSIDLCVNIDKIHEDEDLTISSSSQSIIETVVNVID